MDWKREAADKLRSYAARKCALGSIKEELWQLNSRVTSIRSATTDGTPVSGGGSGRENAYINNIVLREELEQRLHDTRRWLSAVDTALSVLSDEEQLVLDRFYIHPARGNADRLCEELNLEKAGVYKRKDKALEHFTYALYGGLSS